jgi:hypothetical protein
MRSTGARRWAAWKNERALRAMTRLSCRKKDMRAAVERADGGDVKVKRAGNQGRDILRKVGGGKGVRGWRKWVRRQGSGLCPIEMGGG